MVMMAKRATHEQVWQSCSDPAHQYAGWVQFRQLFVSVNFIILLPLLLMEYQNMHGKLYATLAQERACGCDGYILFLHTSHTY